MTRVLVVEDEAVIREAFTMLLEVNDYQVVAAANGLEALKVCKTSSFDIIILDLMMPELDGVGFIREARALGLIDKEKVIVLSNLSSGQELNAVQELGIFRHEVKPNLAPSDILSLVASAT